MKRRMAAKPLSLFLTALLLACATSAARAEVHYTLELKVDPAKSAEIWDSKADHEAYRAWRGETNFGDKIAPFLAGQAVPSYYTKYDD